ncbi:MAG TPA: GatB/YqeY domain-containing protein [Saprospiraceae bacterium]|nr:GatB/YqeY domain-containing protein [Saprospiraceae bacterium]
MSKFNSKNLEMTLEEKIMEDLKEAMKSKNQAALRGIRAVKAAILLAKTDGSGQDITPEREIAILQKLVKQRRESLDIFEKQNREDLAVIEREEIEVIEKYLPKQLSEEELEATVRQIIAQTGAASMKDMGMVMGTASKQLAGKADGRMISEIVKKLLSA